MISATNKGRVIFLGMVLLFVLPAIIAKVVLDKNWYQSGVTNYGKLIVPAASFDSMGLSDPFQSEWKLGYVVPIRCQKMCEQQIHLLQHSHIALGKNQSRVRPILIFTPSSDDYAKKHEQLSNVSVSSQFENVVQSGELVIVDPLGQLVMAYPRVSSQNNMISQSKGVLADLRKLLKLSRVG